MLTALTYAQIASLCDSGELDNDETLAALWDALLPGHGAWTSQREPQRSAQLCNAILRHLRSSPGKQLLPQRFERSRSSPAWHSSSSALSGRLRQSMRSLRLLPATHAWPVPLRRSGASTTPPPAHAAREVQCATGLQDTERATSMRSARHSSATSEASADHSDHMRPQAKADPRRLARRSVRSSSVRSLAHTGALARSSMRLAAKELHTVLETGVAEPDSELRDLSNNLSAFLGREAVRHSSTSQAARSHSACNRAQGVQSAASDEFVVHTSRQGRIALSPGPTEDPIGTSSPQLHTQTAALCHESSPGNSEGAAPEVARPAHAASGAALLPRTSAPIVRHRGTRSTGCLSTATAACVGVQALLASSDGAQNDAAAIQEGNGADASSSARKVVPSSVELAALLSLGSDPPITQHRIVEEGEADGDQADDYLSEHASENDLAAAQQDELLLTVYALIRRVLEGARSAVHRGLK